MSLTSALPVRLTTAALGAVLLIGVAPGAGNAPPRPGDPVVAKVDGSRSISAT